MVRVHPSAVVSESAVLGPGVEVGPMCHVGPDVQLGAGTRLVGSCTVLGPTVLGERNVVHPYAVLGGEPQDRSHPEVSSGVSTAPTTLAIGDDNVFREHVTAHRGTRKDRGITRIGSGCLFMAGSHVAHDCLVGDHVTLANATLLGGHVELGERVTTGGHVALQPFVRVGRLAFLAGGACLERDVPPFVIAAGDRARVRALNTVGLTRAGVDEAGRRALATAFRAIYRAGDPIVTALARLRASDDGLHPLVRELLDFLEGRSFAIADQKAVRR